jgi:hypothetical protein
MRQIESRKILEETYRKRKQLFRNILQVEVVMVILNCQLDWIERCLRDSKAHLWECLWVHFQRWWGHEYSDLINSLIHLWIPNLNRLLAGDELWKVRPGWRKELTGEHVLGGLYLGLAPSYSCSIVLPDWDNQPPPLASPVMMLCPTMGQNQNCQDYRLKSLKPRAKTMQK